MKSKMSESHRYDAASSSDRTSLVFSRQHREIVHIGVGMGARLTQFPTVKERKRSRKTPSPTVLGAQTQTTTPDGNAAARTVRRQDKLNHG